MDLTWTPILANGLVMLEVVFNWAAVLLVAAGVALLAIILASIPRTRKATRWLSLVSLAVSFAPAAVLLWFHEPIASYGQRDIPFFVALSLLPIAMSGVAIWLSRRALPV